MLTFRQFIEEQEKKKKMTKSGGGEYGTDELTKTYKKDTPGQEEQLDEAPIGRIVDLFVQTYRRLSKKKKIDRIIWDTSLWANMNYHALVQALEKEAQRGGLPDDIVKALQPEFKGQKRRSQTIQQMNRTGFNTTNTTGFRRFT